MLFLISYGQQRPSVLEPKKDEDYHLKWARYCVGQTNNFWQQEYVDKIIRNKRFYKDDQWIETEDLEAFFKDSTNQDRNRIKAVQNIIKPMVLQYKGNAIRMKINARVKSVSPMAINRRDDKLAEMMFYSKIANKEGNPYGPALRKANSIGEDDQDTQEIFDNLYEDKYIEKMNDLLQFIASHNRMEDMQDRVAEELCYSGLAAIKEFEFGGHQQFQIVDTENFFFDRSGTEYNLQDCEWMGEVYYAFGSEIYERFPNITEAERESIETYVRQWRKLGIESGAYTQTSTQTSKYMNGGRIPVFRIYWKDSEEYTYGYVMDEYGYPYLTKINFIYEGETEPRYTDKDVIKMDTEQSKRVLDGKMTKKLRVEVLRFSEFIPKEIIGMNEQDPAKKNSYSDILLDWGIYPYQETESLDFTNVKFPFKCYCWGLINGEVLTPIDAVINPQRMINRIASIAENQINNSRGSGIIYDKSSVDPDNGEAELLMNMNQSKPVGVNAKGKGIQNIVTSYDTTVKQGTMILYQINDILKAASKETTGVNDALQGQAQGSDQLVGVTDSQIQRGSIIQEPFYNAITMIFQQCYQSMATRGKRIYADNQRELAIAVGDEGVKVFKISRDMRAEDFRAFVKRSIPTDDLINAGNTELIQLQQLGLLDEASVANLWGRSTPDDIAVAIRKFGKLKQQMGKMQAKQQQQEGAAQQEQIKQIQGQAQQDQHEAIAREDISNLQDKKHAQDMEKMKLLGKLAGKNSLADNLIIRANLPKPEQSLV